MQGLLDGILNSKPEPIHGWLNKQSRGKNVFGSTNWQLRYFIVDNGKISYYSSDITDDPKNKKGELSLAKMKLHGNPEQFSSESKNPSFLIALCQENIGSCELLMEAKSSEEAESWRVAIQAHISHLALQNEQLKKQGFISARNGGMYGFLEDMFTSEPRPLEGYLLKRSRGRSLISFSNWQKRYFVLENGRLGYYDDNSTYEEKGAINLLGVTVHPHPEKFCDDRQPNRLIALSIRSTDSCDLLLEAESGDITDQWKISLNEHIRYATQIESYKSFSSTKLEEHDDEYEDYNEEDETSLSKDRYQQSCLPLPICFVFRGKGSESKKSGFLIFCL